MNSKILVNLSSHELNQEPFSNYTNPQDQLETIELLLETINKAMVFTKRIQVKIDHQRGNVEKMFDVGI